MRYGHLAESSYKFFFSTPTFCVSPNSMVAIYLIFCMRGWHKNITPFSTIFTFIAGPTCNFSAKDSPTLFLRECVNSGHIGLPTLDLGVLYATPCCSWRRNRAPEKKIKYWVRLPVFLLSQTVELGYHSPADPTYDLQLFSASRGSRDCSLHFFWPLSHLKTYLPFALRFLLVSG